MGRLKFNWQKLGLLFKPEKDSGWMVSHTGSTAVLHSRGDKFDFYITGRDSKNRSSIGKAVLNLSNIPKVTSFEKKPILSRGKLGTFDENGVSYPSLVRLKDKIYLYYTGWLPTKITPFQNQLGLAIIKNNEIKRYSRAPILDRNHDDYISIGSAFIMKEGKNWKMWYTSFLEWEKSQKNILKHKYLIKYATSNDGLHWIRKNHIAIDFQNPLEHAICRPSVIKLNNIYHMFFCSKGNNYKLRYAFSDDGVNWTRDDNSIVLKLSNNGWDSKEMCYPHVFRHKNYLYLLYAGNNYGNSGVGLAKMKIE